MIKCPHCGGELTYLPGTEIVKCDYCGSEFSAEEIDNYREVDAAEYQEKSWKDDSTIEATVFTCPQCGGEIYSLDQSAVTFCSYCGSQVTLMSRLTKIRRPDHVIPFNLTAEQGIQEYYKHVRKALFVPSVMKKDSEVEKLRGIYMPYWIYDVKAPQVLNVKSSVEHTQGNYVVKDHYSTEIRAEGGVDGIAFDAAAAFSDEMSDAIGPYDFREAKDYHPGYLSSYYADEGDVDSSLYEEDAIRIAGEKYAEAVYHPDMKNYGLDKSEIAEAFVTDGVDKKLGYFPVWFLEGKPGQLRYDQRTDRKGCRGSAGGLQKISDRLADHCRADLCVTDIVPDDDAAYLGHRCHGAVYCGSHFCQWEAERSLCAERHV